MYCGNFFRRLPVLHITWLDAEYYLAAAFGINPQPNIILALVLARYPKIGLPSSAGDLISEMDFH